MTLKVKVIVKMHSEPRFPDNIGNEMNVDFDI